MKTLHCSDAGFDCKGIIRAETEAEVLNQAAEHARSVHGVEVTPELATQLKPLIKEENYWQKRCSQPMRQSPFF